MTAPATTPKAAPKNVAQKSIALHTRSPCHSKQRHTARRHPIEGRIYYPFYPRCGEPVLIARQYAYRGAELVVIPQPDGSVACIPGPAPSAQSRSHKCWRLSKGEASGVVSFTPGRKGWRPTTQPASATGRRSPTLARYLRIRLHLGISNSQE
jgi:hypothetical protein